MPLVRYEIRNEHSLANPQLYRTAAKDDPEGLLEGVAMAGLVGIVRQLGDLAEFAAEVFRDLHEEVMATASRGHELLARVQQLEAEMPAVEKALLSETNQLRFAYTPGVEWHASIRNDQNHCTQGDLPRFIRSSYEECRGPPRLFLLDKFDVAGAGACLKRYTDPSFFRTEWASSELMKAERVQRDKKARREKKKGRRRRNADGKESILAEQYHSTFSHELSRELSQRNQAHSRHVAGDGQALKQHLARTSNSSPGSARQTLDTFMDIPVPDGAEVPTSSPNRYKKSESINESMLREWEESAQGVSHTDEIALETQEEEAATTAVDDGGSEGDQYLDALTTMESEADSDSEKHLRQDRDVNADKLQDTTEAQATSHEEDLKVPNVQTSAEEKITPSVTQSGKSMSLDSPRQETSLEPRVITNGKDVQGIASSTTAMHARRRSSDAISSSTTAMHARGQSSDSISSSTAIHARRPSSDSIASSTTAMHARRKSSDSTSSQNFRRGKHLFEEPRESFRPRSEPLKDEKGVTESFDQGSFMSFNSGIKVSKIVAAFESGSLEQVQVEGLEKEREGSTMVSLPEGSVSDAVSQGTVEVDARVGVPEDHNSESNFLESSLSQFGTSPQETDSTSSKDGSPKSRVSLPGSIKGKSTSISSHTSVGSLDSPPDSPAFNALQSPVSPTRTERNILNSPDSHGLGFPVETLSPGSPTAVPVLALSPTSQERRHLTIEPFSLTSPSSSPVEFPSSPHDNQYSDIISRSQTTYIDADDSATTALQPAEDASRLQSVSPTRSLDDPVTSIPPVLPPELVSPVQRFSDEFEESHDLPLPAHDLVHISTDEYELSTSSRAEGVEYNQDLIPSTSLSIDDEIFMSSSIVNDNNVPHHASSEVEERIPQEPISVSPPPSVSKSNHDPSSQSPLPYNLTPQNQPLGKHDKLSLPSTSSRRSFETVSQLSRSEASHDYLFIPNASHRRFPSLPLVGKTVLDFSHAAPSNITRSPPRSLMPSKTTSSAQPPAKISLKAPSPSPMSRIVYDLPYPTLKTAHTRRPSFPSSERSMLEVAASTANSLQLPSTSATPSRHAADAQVPESKSPNERQSSSEILSNLPTPTPPSKSERDLSPPPPPPFQAMHELPPPPPPPGGSPPLSATKTSSFVDAKDGILEAIASHDKSTLKKVKTLHNPTLRKADERSHLLEQIRAKSFNLRHTVVEKVDPPLPRPVTNINVAAILEKANAIRQAFAGSDEDDEDTDDWNDV